MKKETYEELMNSQEIVQVKSGYRFTRGQLFGYLSMKDPTKIGVA